MLTEALPNGALEQAASGSEHQALSSPRVVLKFGGTSIGKFALQIAQICLSSVSSSNIAIVCSARSGRTKAEGTTNRLLKISRDAFKPDSNKSNSIVSEIYHEHINAMQLKSSQLAKKLEQGLLYECEELKAYLAQLPQDQEHDQQSFASHEDRVVRVGEQLSAQFLATVLEDHGIQAQYIDLSNIFDGAGLDRMSQESYHELAQIIGQKIRSCGPKVPVLTGFFGRVPGGLLSTCGRGYSDLCAALAAVGSDAMELQVWKEVSGVYTADPRMVPTARLLSTIDASEVEELTFFGSEVVHHFTVEQCIPKIPIRIKNVLEPEGAGTVISSHDPTKVDPYQSRRPKRPTAVSVKHRITVVNVHSHKKVGNPKFLAEICKILEESSLDPNLFELNEHHVSLAVHSKTNFIKEADAEDQDDLQSQHRDLHNAIERLKEYGTVDVVENLAILSLIGRQLKQTPGIAGRFMSALGDNNINLEMISQGASELNISVVILEREALRAINVVHTHLFTFLD